jgi:hypothetical protein
LDLFHSKVISGFYTFLTNTKQSGLRLSTLLLIAFISTCSLATVSAQSYDQATGLRGGITNGITYKHFLGEQDAVELIAGLQDNGLRVTGLYERHVPALDMAGFYWYYGAGGHLGFYDNNYNPPYRDNDRDGGTAIGVDGIAGLEYRIADIPIVISADVKPFIEVTEPDLYLWDTGLSLRYTF